MGGGDETGGEDYGIAKVSIRPCDALPTYDMSQGCCVDMRKWLPRDGTVRLARVWFTVSAVRIRMLLHSLDPAL